MGIRNKKSVKVKNFYVWVAFRFFELGAKKPTAEGGVRRTGPPPIE